MGSDSERLGFPPPHPGDYLREDILPATGMKIGELASHLGVTRATLSELIHCKRAVSTTMAIRLGRAFQTGSRFWLALQSQYDLWHEEQRFSDEIKPVKATANEPEAA